MNSNGGTIYIGVEDNGEVIGVSDELKDKYNQQLSSIISDAIIPNPRSLIKYDYNEDNVLEIRIDRGTDKPYYLSSKGPKPSGTYIRYGTTKRQATDLEILTIIRDYSGWLWEKRISENQALHFKYLKICFDTIDLELTDDDFVALGLKDLDGHFTNLAYLLSEENKVEVKFAYLDDNLDFRSWKTHTGSLLRILDDVLRDADALNVASAKIIPGKPQRVDVVSYPRSSLREAILNAFCHCDYSFPSNIKIDFYDSKCVISNPGAIYMYDLKEALKGQQSFRNPGLVKILFMLGYIENYGKGLKRIRDAYKNYDIDSILMNNAHSFIVELPNMSYIKGENDTNHDTNNVTNDTNNNADVTSFVTSSTENVTSFVTSETKNVTSFDTKPNKLLDEIIELIKKNPKISTNEMARILGKSRMTIARAIKKSNTIKFVGKTSAGHWEITEEN